VPRGVCAARCNVRLMPGFGGLRLFAVVYGLLIVDAGEGHNH
jgi:hypothetical protein